ncbi:MAG: T9SS type A sorting domain-containing protein [Saprospiraceae bacterium]|nr:T9SS type A sorting domain-containing protein [Saprospiraceae bacterium]
MNRLLLFLLLVFSHNAWAQQMSWITDCSDKTFCQTFGGCSGGKAFMTEKAVTNCGSPNINYSYRIDLNNDNVVDIQSSADTVDATFQVGTHRITWRATDNCGNLLQCTYLFQVKDCQPPSLLCINGLTQSLDQPDCTIGFTASQFILTLNDNCTPLNQIELGIRKAGDGMGFPEQDSIHFDQCEKGFNNIEVWVRDGDGLTNVCTNYVLIQDSNEDCICNNDADVHWNGCARTFSNQQLNTFRLNTRLETLPNAANPLVKNYSQMVEDSCYTLHLNGIPFGNDYRAVVRGERKLGPLVGVTTFDLVLTSKHILALEPFTSVYQSVAADVNQSKSVTTFDIVETRKLILGIYDTFPLAPAWRITRPVANPSQVANFNALVDTYQVFLPNLIDDVNFQGLQFIGIKYGDVNGSAMLQGEPGADDRYQAPPILFQTDDIWLEAGAEVLAPFRFTENMRLDGWQLALLADPDRIQFLELSGLPPDHFVLHAHSLRALWADGAGASFAPDAPVFYLKIRAIQSGWLSKALSFDPEKLRPEVYVSEVSLEESRRPLVLHHGAQERPQSVFFPPSPNPFSRETSFDVWMAQDGTVHLEIFDLNGRLLQADQFEVEAGLQSLRVSGSLLPVQGVLMYRIRADKSVSSGKLVRVTD